MKISKKSKYLALIILFIVVSTLAYEIGTLRGFSHGQELAMITEASVTIMTTQNFLEAYHSGNNKKMEQLLDMNLDVNIGALLSIAKHETYKKEPVAVKMLFKYMGAEYQIQDVIKKILTRAAEYRRDNAGEFWQPSEENYKLLMTYLPKDSVNSTKE